ncbi:MAG: hypothetical protein P0Y56_06420 [Candidatus Andeanibacterium colombiense]|uniref:Uncharacterized protein n=1 Tax=Candidatus Andeanibacterium colombiense TaxID=3121345 RepID=A0AAJ5XAS8_9SPHN|nr:MAG: hypothetical protein P0Y56_06420 [Sphingomonadaceae bacterium]
MADGKSPESEDDGAEHRANTALVVDVALREGSLLARRAISHKLAGGDFKDIKRAKLPRAGFGKRVAAAALARLAARSVPGTLLVAGGLVAKALVDRRRARRRRGKTTPD